MEEMGDPLGGLPMGTMQARQRCGLQGSPMRNMSQHRVHMTSFDFVDVDDGQ